jgi:hypothetical protein
VVLRLSGAIMRLALKDRADAVELTLSGGMWFSNDAQQEVFFEFTLDSEATQTLVWNQRSGPPELVRLPIGQLFNGLDRNWDARSPVV